MPKAPIKTDELRCKKRMSICQSTAPSKLQRELHDVTGASVIYSRSYQGGTVYMLIHDSPAKKHVTLDKVLMDLEDMHKNLTGNSADIFKKVSEVLNGKVKTFKRGEHATYELFNVICATKNPSSKQLKVHQDVEIWTPESDRLHQEHTELLRVHEDVYVQDLIMMMDPEAFGMEQD